MHTLVGCFIEIYG
jgi:calcium-dependent protein kinase